jgi:hypothetical protein
VQAGYVEEVGLPPVLKTKVIFLCRLAMWKRLAYRLY